MRISKERYEEALRIVKAYETSIHDRIKIGDVIEYKSSGKTTTATVVDIRHGQKKPIKVRAGWTDHLISLRVSNVRVLNTPPPEGASSNADK